MPQKMSSSDLLGGSQSEVFMSSSFRIDKKTSLIAAQLLLISLELD